MVRNMVLIMSSTTLLPTTAVRPLSGAPR
jgi:hypothetical protein